MELLLFTKVAPQCSGSACGFRTQGLGVRILHVSQLNTMGEKGSGKQSYKHLGGLALVSAKPESNGLSSFQVLLISQ